MERFLCTYLGSTICLLALTSLSPVVAFRSFGCEVDDVGSENFGVLIVSSRTLSKVFPARMYWGLLLDESAVRTRKR